MHPPPRYAATVDEWKGICKGGAKVQKDFCAAHPDWIPNTAALDWQIQNPTENYLHKIQIFTPAPKKKDGETCALDTECVSGQCDAGSKQCKEEKDENEKKKKKNMKSAKDLVLPPTLPCPPTETKGTCRQKFTVTDRGKKDKDAHHTLGTLKFRVRVVRRGATGTEGTEGTTVGTKSQATK